MIEGLFFIICLVCSTMVLFKDITNVRPRKVLIRGLVLCILIFIISLSPLAALSNFFLTLYLIIIYHDSNSKISFWHLIHNSLILTLVPIIVGFITYYLLHTVFTVPAAYPISSALTLLICFIFYKLHIIRNIVLVEINPIVTTLEVFGAIFLFLIFQFSQSGSTIFIYVMGCIMLVPVVYKLGSYIESKTQLEKSYQMQLLYSRQLEELNDEMKSFKHDYINLLLILKKSIDSKDIIEIRDIFYNTLLPTKDSMLESETNVEKYKHFYNPEIKNLLLFKEFEASSKGIEFDLEVIGDIKATNVTTVELVRIVSILLDNAIQATLQSNSSKKIYINFSKLSSELLITIKNPIIGLKFDREKMFQKEYSTSPNDLNHGIGLFSLQRLVDKNPYISLITEYTTDSIIQSIIIRESEN